MGFNNSKFLVKLCLIYLNISNAYSNTKRCEIKYGEIEGIEELEKKVFQRDLDPLIKKKYGFECYQIGVEHDEHLFYNFIFILKVICI